MEDNIEYVERPPSPAGAAPADDNQDDNLDEYLQRFDKIGSLNDELAKLKTGLLHAASGDERIHKLIQSVFKLEQISQEQHSLLIEMNNLFGSSK